MHCIDRISINNTWVNCEFVLPRDFIFELTRLGEFVLDCDLMSTTRALPWLPRCQCTVGVPTAVRMTWPPPRWTGIPCSDTSYRPRLSRRCRGLAVGSHTTLWTNIESLLYTSTRIGTLSLAVPIITCAVLSLDI